MKLNLIPSFLAVVFAFTSTGVFAKSSYEKFPAPKKGGTFNDVIVANPTTLNPLIATSVDDMTISGYFYMGLMGRDMQTYEDLPGLAQKVEVSQNKKEYTFTLYKNAKWSDGTPVTSDDVEFTFNKIMDTKVDAAALRSFYDGVTFQKIDQLKFKFIVPVPKYNSLSSLTTFVPVQKKQFEKEADFNKSKENLRPIGNGPYKLKAISRDQYVTLEKDQNWWAKDFPENKPTANFDLIQMKIIPDQALSYENFMRGNIDTMNFLADQYATQVKKVDQDKFGSKPDTGKSVWAGEFKSDGSMPAYSLRLNLKNSILSSHKVRIALAHLIDYQAVTERGYYNTVYQSVSPFGSRTDNTPTELKTGAKTFKLDPKKAAAILKEDGWADTNQDGLLDKVLSGKLTPLKLEVKLATINTSGMRSVQIFKETFKKAGIELTIRGMDIPALFKDVDDRNFEIVFMGWGGGSIYPDPKQIWHSDSIDHGGSNMVSYSNPKVDRLIEKANLEFDKKKRSKILQEINREIYNDVPYIFLVERGSIYQGFNSKVKSPIWSQRYSTSVTKDLFHF
jgi:ABC-type transport system substrate-binding protein